MRCENCIYWEAPDKDEWCPIRAVMGFCKRTPHTESMTGWDDDCNRFITSDFADRSAAAFDASGYSAGLLTKPEHFCAMFKGQEP